MSMRERCIAFAVVGFVALLNIRSTAQVTIDMATGKVTDARPAANQPLVNKSQRTDKLTNQDVIEMVASKLPDDIVASKLRSVETDC